MVSQETKIYLGDRLTTMYSTNDLQEEAILVFTMIGQKQWCGINGMIEIALAMMCQIVWPNVVYAGHLVEPSGMRAISARWP